MCPVALTILLSLLVIARDVGKAECIITMLFLGATINGSGIRLSIIKQ